MGELKSNTEWIQWGKDDPLWAVASCPEKQKEGGRPWTDEDFYAYGASNWRDFFEQWVHYGVDRESCLEVGCGAGRFTLQLACVFEQVEAVDVSKNMIEYAREKLGLTNVSFSVIDGIHLPQTDRSVKAVFSTHVLQHLDTAEVGFAYFREFYRVLDWGGTLMVHLPLYQIPAYGITGAVMRRLYSVYRLLGQARADVRRRVSAKTMRRTPYPIDDLHKHLNSIGFRNVEFRIFPTKINGDLHPFVFASK